MRKKILGVLGIAFITGSFVGCSTKDGMTGDVIPEYFKIEAHKDVDVSGFNSVYSKIYDINNDGIFEEIELVKKGDMGYILFKHAEKGDILSSVRIESNMEAIEKIYDENNDGIEEIFIKDKDGKTETYSYNKSIKGYE
ncbi:MAG: hypothetical protein ACRC28_13400 [Clostridium sp.]|uniref:hypothetical protein n=1 Tax=Clostridium sp. TaxID=1506 RepID=UPI003F2E7500